jgi:hypothetical protein
MEVNFSDTFKQSLKRVYWEQSWLYKGYSFFRRDLWQFFMNIYRFRKVLWSHRWWDYHYTLEALKTSLEIMQLGLIEKGIEEDQSLNKKIEKIGRAIQIINGKNELDFIERAEAELGQIFHRDWQFEDLGNGTSRLIDTFTPEEKEHNRRVYDRASEIEREEWEELWQIFKGKNHKQWNPDEMSWHEWFDGAGMESWWD